MGRAIGETDFWKIPKLRIGFLSPVIGSEHHFNHILPSAGWGSSGARSVSLAGTISSLEVNDSMAVTAVGEETECEPELKIPGPSMLQV